MVTVNLVFMVTVAGLDPLQMVLVGTALELSAFLFEIPTGVVADAVSRKLSVIIGHALTGVGFLVIVLFPNFFMILVSQVIWGIGWTFISGAYPAWLTEEVGVERAGHAFLRASQVSHAAAFVGIGLCVALAHVSLALPIAVGAIGYLLLAGAMTVLMRERNFHPQDDAQRDTWQSMAHVFRDGVSQVRLQPVLVLMLLIAVVFGLFSEGIDRLFTPYLIESFTFPSLGGLETVTWWGIIAAISSLFGLAATTLARRYVNLEDPVSLSRVLGGALAAISASVLLLANLDGFLLVLGFFWLTGALRSAYDPLVAGWLNRLLPARSRATLFSMYGQADAVGQSFGGPIVGVLAKYISIAFALGASAISLLPALPLYRRVHDRVHGELVS
jgi:DHA3 family tetracycline resistance protein-like MFS transporter